MVSQNEPDTQYFTPPRRHTLGKLTPQVEAGWLPPAHTWVIIPAYNEAASIGAVVQEVRTALGPAVPIVVVDDGSADATAACALAAGAVVLQFPYNLGVGAGMQAGLQLAVAREAAYALRLDGDGQHNPYDALALLAVVARGEADVAIGSRWLSPRNIGQAGATAYRPPAGRALGIWLFANLIQLLTGQPTTDPTSGLHAYNRRAMRYLARHHPQDYPEVETRIMLVRRGLRVVERPATMRPRLAGASSITRPKALYYAARVTVAAWIAFLRSPPADDDGQD